MAVFPVWPLQGADRQISRQIPAQIFRTVPAEPANRFRHRLSLAHLRDQFAAGGETTVRWPGRGGDRGDAAARRGPPRAPAAPAAGGRAGRILVVRAAVALVGLRATNAPTGSAR